MTGEPPIDDPWGDVVSQVTDALSELNLHDGALRSALLDGLRTALGQFEEDNKDVEAPPGVVVVEGGRSEDAPVTPITPPMLRVADDPTEEEVPEVRTRVRVVRVDSDVHDIPDDPDWLAAPITHEGRIRVGDPTTASGWQTVLRATSAQTYRLNCDRGALEVFLEGEPAEKLATGQTVDVEAQLIRVRSASPHGAEGSYVRL